MLDDELTEFVLCAFEAFLLDLNGLIPSEMDKLEIKKK